MGEALPEPDRRGERARDAPVFELEDFGDNVTPEVRERDERLRSEIEEQRS